MKKAVVVFVGLFGVLAAGCMALALGKGGGSFPLLKEKSGISPEFVFTYAENQPQEYPTTRGAMKFADLVFEETKGRIKINVFSGGELGDEVSVLDQLQFGGVDFARVSVMTMGTAVPQLNVLQLPYLYRDGNHMWKALDGEIGQEFMESLEGSGVVGMSWYDAGARHFYNSVKPIERLEDIRGMRIRVAESELMSKMVEALGAKPIPMAYSEVYAALEIGRIDGAENNWPSYESMRHFEVAKYMTVDGHNRIPELQLVSEATWNKMGEEDREIIMKCAKESSVYERGLWAEWEKAAEERLLKKGCIVTELTHGEQIRFRASVMTVYQMYGKDYIDVVNRIEEIQ
ncbi:TRAP transporter substrate-binding protein [Lacrimispora sp.]|uniref:TRAP transporter substrate-binding protein n=1 Tax=Lacrimispora sp. TaxID=2719234 RepID=UPI00345FCE1C